MLVTLQGLLCSSFAPERMFKTNYLTIIASFLNTTELKKETDC
jgi:hypothetical protein